jgi:hypothetical protein
MTLALKSWIEVRRRLLIGLLGWAFVTVTFYFSMRDDSIVRSQTARTVSAICSVETVMLMSFGAILAGSGVMTQICNATSARMPDSALFTLSLPVSRRRLFLSRAVLGALGVLLMIALFWALLPLLFASITGAPTLRVLAGAILFQFVTAALAYTFGLLGTCLLNDMTLSWVIGAAGGLGGIGAGLRWGPLVRFLNFASGATYMTTGQISWTGLTVCVALSCLFVFAAVRTIERREF